MRYNSCNSARLISPHANGEHNHICRQVRKRLHDYDASDAPCLYLPNREFLFSLQLLFQPLREPVSFRFHCVEFIDQSAAKIQAVPLVCDAGRSAEALYTPASTVTSLSALSLQAYFPWTSRNLYVCACAYTPHCRETWARSSHWVQSGSKDESFRGFS
jgi:hypothetical protein